MGKISEEYLPKVTTIAQGKCFSLREIQEVFLNSKLHKQYESSMKKNREKKDKEFPSGGGGISGMKWKLHKRKGNLSDRLYYHRETRE